METLRSLASGIGGRSLGTERPPASTSLASGAVFAREVERAARSRGRELATERADEQDALRRADRRSGFGRQAAEEGAARDVEHDGRPPEARDHAPETTPRPRVPAESTEAPATPEAALQASVPRTLPADSAPRAGAEPLALPAPAASTTAVAVSSANPARVEQAPAPASPNAARAETSAVELAQTAKLARERTPRPSASERASAGPDPALLERAEAILRQVELRLVPGLQRLTFDLEPAELGRLSVQLAFKHGKLSALVRAEREKTLELLQLRAPELVDLLAQRGIDADSVQLELGRFGQRAGGRERAASEPAATAAGNPVAVAQILTNPEPRGPRSLVDTYA